MHTAKIMTHWSHYLHEGMHHINIHLHSRFFWTGVGFALCFVFVMALLFIAINYGFVNMPSNSIHTYGP